LREVGGTYLRPKDSNAVVRVGDRARGKTLEGADRQTDCTRIIARYVKDMSTQNTCMRLVHITSRDIYKYIMLLVLSTLSGKH